MVVEKNKEILMCLKVVIKEWPTINLLRKMVGK